MIGKVELINGRVVMGRYELVFSPAQHAAAESLGVRARSCVDALIERRELREELAVRLAAGESRSSGDPPAIADAEALTEQYLAEVVAGRRDPREIPPPPPSLGEHLDGPADLLARAVWVYAQGGAAAVTVASWATSPDPKLDGLSPAQWADRGLDARRLLRIAWRNATLFAR